VALLCTVAAVLAACGSGAGSGAPSASASTSPQASNSATASSSAATSATTTTFSCAIKPGGGLLPSQTARPGRIVASIADIESAIGLTMSTSVDISMVAGITQCRYQIGQSGQVDITILGDAGRSAAELATTKSKNLSLHDRSCNGCSLTGLTSLPELGSSGYRATSDNGSPVFGSITAGIYFEVEGSALKDARLERLALVIAGNLSGTTPSLPALPTPTATP
jgi:hypothetical protein